jgi:hypothetical protein
MISQKKEEKNLHRQNSEVLIDCWWWFEFHDELDN